MVRTLQLGNTEVNEAALVERASSIRRDDLRQVAGIIGG